VHGLPGESGVALTPSRQRVATPVGDAEVLLDVPRGLAKAILAIGHGAGGDIEAPDLGLLKTAALRAGIAVALVRQPYRVAGRRAPAPTRQLDAAWITVIEWLRTAPRLRKRPVVAAGRSSGARVACRTASACDVAGVVALAFPLHPPGHPEKTRADELAVGRPLLVVQGTRDAFGRAGEFPRDIEMIEVEGADHGLKAAAFEAAAASAVEWILAKAAG
jgi:hypothetical protein